MPNALESNSNEEIVIVGHVFSMCLGDATGRALAMEHGNVHNKCNLMALAFYCQKTVDEGL